MQYGGSLLVIDEMPDTAEVLKAVFEPRGVRVDRFRSQSSAVRTEEAAAAPAVVVIDGESWQAPDPQNVPWAASPRVIIGQARMSLPPASGNGRSTEFLGKPFEFSELIGAIENLLRGD